MVTKFLDGPAQGKHLSLSCAPELLRVVQNTRTNEFDALDKKSDEPTSYETVFVYKLKESNGGCFVDGRDPKTGKRFLHFSTFASYELYEDQPPKSVTDDNQLWASYCEQKGFKV